MVVIKALFLLLVVCSTWNSWAGGSGLNVVVVVNQNSANSVQLGNDYCAKRSVPSQNLFRMTNWTGGSVAWSRSDFEAYLRDPLLARLSASGLTNQITHVLLSMDIPYRVEEADSGNSTTSVLFYGFKTNTPIRLDYPPTCSLPDSSSNSFAFSESPSELVKPNTAETNSFLAFMLTDSTLAGAQAILARGLASDSSFPTQTVYLEKTSDSARNVRFYGFDNAMFDNRLRGDPPLVRIDSDATGFEALRGFLTGFAALTLPADTFVPGAIGDSLTSYAGRLFEDVGQTTLLAFLEAGAAASYGTVIEPCAYTQKFPDSLAYVYQNRGFDSAEAYYLSVLNPYQGLFVGEPLSAPFAAPGSADWPGVTNGMVLTGLTSLPSAIFTVAAQNLPLDQVDLFVDGLFYRAVTNIPPSASGQISISINQSTIVYSIPTNATRLSVASGLADLINESSNSTQVAALKLGDHLELQALDVAQPGSNFIISASSTPGSAVFLNLVRSNFVDTMATGLVGFTVTNRTSSGDWLNLALTKTNASQVSLSVTNVGLTNVFDLCVLLRDAVNLSPELQGPDGIVGREVYPDNDLGQFFLYARSAGWPAAKIQVTLTASSNLMVLNPGTHTLEDNVSDLRPRNHLYLGSGSSEIALPLTLDTTGLPDGFHELTLVAYEGTSVRTQTHVSRTVQVRNGNLSAVLLPETSGTNVSVDAPLNISVISSNSNISSIELFSTGGSLGVISNQSLARFSVALGLLGPGLHRFYALVTDTAANQYRTEVMPLQVLPSFTVSISAPPLRLSWAAVPGVVYTVLASTNLASSFQKIADVIPSGSTAEWLIPSSASPSFYRIGISP